MQSLIFQELIKASDQFLMVAELALPYRHYTPTESSQMPFISNITFAIRPNLWAPESKPRFWNAAAARMSVPEATMNEDGAAKLREDYIGRTW